jgi:hypothetical protein
MGASKRAMLRCGCKAESRLLPTFQKAYHSRLEQAKPGPTVALPPLHDVKT